MKKLTAVIDIDNTIADTQNTIKEYLLSKGVDPIRLANYNEEFRDDTKEDFNVHITEFIYSGDYGDTVSKVRLYPGVIEALKELSKLYNLYIVSSRINNWHTPTRTWLTSQLITPLVKGVYLRDQSESSVAFKRRVIEELGANVVFEDSLETIRALAGSHTSFLVDQPWNRDTHSKDKVIRVKNLAEAVAFIKASYPQHHMP